MRQECIQCNKLFSPEDYRSIGLKPHEGASICPGCIIQTCAGKLAGSMIIRNAVSLLRIIEQCFDFEGREREEQELREIIARLEAMYSEWKELENGG